MSYLAKNYNRKKISFKHGKGSYLYSTDNKKYLDFVQGIAVNSLGHAHPKLINTINNQNFVSAYHPIVDSTKELNSHSKKIIDVIADYKKTNIKSLISDSEKLSISKLNIMKEIKWLIQIGIIRLYESGQIELINCDKS